MHRSQQSDNDLSLPRNSLKPKSHETLLNAIAHPLIIGHRGASVLAPENTLASFSRAITDGADGFEFDVRLSRDQVPVVIHDADLRRTGNQNLTVADLTAEQLSQIDVGSWFNLKFPQFAQTEFEGERIPTLKCLLETFRVTETMLYLELKSHRRSLRGAVAPVLELLQDLRLKSRTIIECFDLEVLAEVKRLDQKMRTAALFEPSLKQPLSSLNATTMLTRARDIGADEVALHHRLVSAKTVATARQMNLSCVVWTVDDPRWLERGRALGLKALITNNPRTMSFQGSADQRSIN